MKHKICKTEFGPRRYTEYELEDILSDKNPEFKRNRRWKNWKMLFKGNWRRTNEGGIDIAKKIIKVFLELMLTDLIKNNYMFVLKFRDEDLMNLFIGYKQYTFRNFKYNISTGGFNYLPRTKPVGKAKYRLHKVTYYLRVYGKYRRMLDDEIINGHKYYNE